MPSIVPSAAAGAPSVVVSNEGSNAVGTSWLTSDRKLATPIPATPRFSQRACTQPCDGRGRRGPAASSPRSSRKVPRAWAREREDAALRGRCHAGEPALELAAGALEVAAQALLEPRARITRTRLAAQRGELAPEVGAGVGVAHRAPAGAAGPAAAPRALDAEPLVREVGAEPVDPDPGEVLDSVVGILEGTLEVCDIGLGLLVRVAR